MRLTAMTDAEAAECVERTERFIESIFDLIGIAAGVAADANDQDACRRLVGIAKSIDAVDYIELANLATINEAMRGGLLDAIAMKLKAVGITPQLSYDNAPAFFAAFKPMLEAGLN